MWILDLKVNAKSGVYDVVGMTNWRGETATRELSFADKLGLDAKCGPGRRGKKEPEPDSSRRSLESHFERLGESALFSVK